MKYIFTIALRRVKTNLITNLLIFIQMIAGVIMLTIFLNINFFINSEYKDYISSNEYNRFRLYADKLDINDDTSLPINYQQEELLSVKTGNNYKIDVLFDLITFVGQSHINDEGESIVDRYVVDFSSQDDKILIDEEFLRVLQAVTPENTVNLDDMCFSVMENNIVFQNNEKVPYTIQEFDAEKNYHQIKIPLKYYYLYNTSNSFSDCYIELDFNGQSNDSINHTLYDIETELKNYNTNYDYIESNEFFDYLYKSSFDSNQAKLFSFISVLLIFIVYIGMLSLFIMLIEKRKFEIAVCLALGAGKRQVFAELSLEFLIISITPSLIGLILANVFISRGFEFINIYISDYSILAEILLVISIAAINFLCLFCVFYKIRKLKPQEILYKNK